MEPAHYSAVDTLRDGRPVEIRALRPDDRDSMIDVVDHMSDETLYFRFFAPKRRFTENEIDYFINVDFVDHVALVAVVDEGGRSQIVGGARYIKSRPGCAEVAFAVTDACQGCGVATVLMRHLFAVAREAGLHELEAEVLPENRPMLHLFERCGRPVELSRAHGSVRVAIDLRQ